MYFSKHVQINSYHDVQMLVFLVHMRRPDVQSMEYVVLETHNLSSIVHTIHGGLALFYDVQLVVEKEGFEAIHSRLKVERCVVHLLENIIFVIF